jgi:hypothetical protein
LPNCPKILGFEPRCVKRTQADRAANLLINFFTKENLPMFNLKTSKSSLWLVAVLTFAGGIAHAQAGLNDLQIAHAAYTADVIDSALK